MSSVKTRPVDTPAEPVRHGERREVLNDIAKPGVALAVWERVLPDRLSTIAAKAVHQQLSWRGTCHASSNAPDSGCPEILRPLLSDMIELAEPLRLVASSSAFRVRLETVSDDGCRRFHLDNVPARLVTTYHGMGTQWVPPGWADPSDVRAVDYDGPRRTMDVGHVAIFKGSKTTNSNLILHRSPPVRAQHEARLVGVVDLAL